MVYLEKFTFLTRDQEEEFLRHLKQNCYTTKYPFNVFRYRELPRFEFAPITIFYGTNGSGKSTLLNVMAEKLHIPHRTIFNKSNFFSDYVSRCRAKLSPKFYDKNLRKSKIITSDDVFDYLIDIRHLNEGTDRRREELFREYDRIWRDMTAPRGPSFRVRSLDDYDKLVKYNDAAALSKSEYTRRHGVRNIESHSNGEEALRFFTEQIEDNAIYLLDEPENSFSAENQLKLQQFITDSARFFGCQFVICTHSPFFLSIPEATIYDLDETPPRQKPWTELPNIRAYYELFSAHWVDFVKEKP